MDDHCTRCGCNLVGSYAIIVRNGKRVCRGCAQRIDNMKKIMEHTPKSRWEETIDELLMIRSCAIEKGKDVLIENITIDSLDHVINSAIDFIQDEYD